MPSLGELPHPGIEPVSPALQVDFLPAELPRKPVHMHIFHHILISFFNITSLYSFLLYVIIIIQVILL